MPASPTVNVPEAPGESASFRDIPRALGRILGQQLSLRRWAMLAACTILLLSAVVRYVDIDKHPRHDLAQAPQHEREVLENTLAFMLGRNIPADQPLALYRWLGPQMEVAQVLRFWDHAPAKGRWRERIVDFAKEVRDGPAPYLSLLRANMVLFGCGVVVLAFVIARYLAGTASGLLTAFVAAVWPALVVDSGLPHYDMPMLFWFCIALFTLAWTWQHRSTPGLYWSALLLGVACCFEREALLSWPLFIAVGVSLCASSGRSQLARQGGHFLAASAVALVVLAWGYPALLDKEVLSGLITRSWSGGSFTPVSGELLRFWLSMHWSKLVWGIQWILVVGLAGLVWLRHQGATSAFFLCATLSGTLIALYSTSSAAQVLSPSVPGLCLGAAGWALLIDKARRSVTRVDG